MRLLWCVLIAAAGWTTGGLADEPGGSSTMLTAPAVEQPISTAGLTGHQDTPASDVFQPVAYQRHRGGGGFRRPHRVSLTVFIGRNDPLGDFGDRSEDSFLWGLGVRVSVVRFYALALNFRDAPNHDYTRALMDDRVTAGAIGNGSGEFQVRSLTLDHYLALPLPRMLFLLRPVLIAGAGMYRTSSDPVETDILPGDTKTKTEFGYSLGGGIGLGGGPGGGVTLELRYQAGRDSYKAFSIGAGIAIPVF